MIVQEQVTMRKQPAKFGPKRVRETVLQVTKQVLRDHYYNPDQQVNETVLTTVLSTIGIWDRILRESVEQIDQSLAESVEEKIVLFIREQNKKPRIEEASKGKSLLQSMIDTLAPRVSATE
jgi:hypothetical protein